MEERILWKRYYEESVSNGDCNARARLYADIRLGEEKSRERPGCFPPMSSK